LKIKNCNSLEYLNIWYCSALNLTIEGDLWYINAYKTSFVDSWSLHQSCLKLLNGRFFGWLFNECEVHFNTSNAILQKWTYTGMYFSGTIENTDISDCIFNSKIKNSSDYGILKIFHGGIKQLYSQIGKKNEASKHFYLEKTYERKSYLRKPLILINRYTGNAKWIYFFLLCTQYSFKYLYSGFLNVLWGYGERPSRVFVISIFVIILYSIIYCYSYNSSVNTHHNFINSLYYSIVTFSTLGYGDISQTDKYLRLLSGIEALLGMSLWGILIAGFTSNAKAY